MEHKHTPGPWLVATSNSWRRIVSQHGDVVCTPCNQPDGHPDLTFPNGGAEGSDARLIAAAPDLLEALIEVTATLAWIAHGECRAVHDGPIMPSSQAVEVAKVAIAKAVGSQS